MNRREALKAALALPLVGLVPAVAKPVQRKNRSLFDMSDEELAAIGYRKMQVPVFKGRSAIPDGYITAIGTFGPIDAVNGCYPAWVRVSV